MSSAKKRSREEAAIDTPSAANASGGGGKGGGDKYFIAAVTDAFIGASSIAPGSKMDRPSVPVFALTVLLSMIKNKPPQCVSSVASFREVVVEPALKRIVDGKSERPLIQEALNFILKFAKQQLLLHGPNNNNDEPEEDFYSQLGTIRFDIGGKIEVELKPFGDFVPDENKYPHSANKEKVTSYFQSLKTICYFLQKFPMFRFSDLRAKEEYFSQLKETAAYAQVKVDAEKKILLRRQELGAKRSKYDAHVKTFDAKKRELENDIALAHQGIKADETKLANAKESMRQFMESVLSCIECDLQEEYENMKNANERQMKMLTSKLEESLAGKTLSKGTMEGELKILREENERWKSDFVVMEQDTKLLDSVEDECGIKLKIKEAVDAYVEKFKPILNYIEQETRAMSDILAAMRELISAQEVVQEGLFSMKTSLEAFLESSA